MAAAVVYEHLAEELDHRDDDSDRLPDRVDGDRPGEAALSGIGRDRMGAHRDDLA
jgi:hypothetical protein